MSPLNERLKLNLGTSCGVGAASCLLLGLVSGCSSAPRVDPFTLRMEVTGCHAFRPAGIVRAREDEKEGELEGDNLHLQRDLEADGAFGWGVAADVRPFLNDELRASFRQVGDFEGHAVLGRPRRFDGRTYGAGERIESEVAWENLAFSAAHRVLAIQNPTEPAAPLADVLLRLGIESSTFESQVEGSATPKESRQVRSGAPLAGVEGRVVVLPRTLFELSLAAGYWNHHGARLKLCEAVAGFRVNVAGPLDLLLRYDFVLRDARSRLAEGEISRAVLQTHIVWTGLAASF